MRATRLIAATTLAFLWLGVSLSQFTTGALSLAALLSLAVVAAAWGYERRYAADGAGSRHASLDDALRRRAQALGVMQQRSVQAVVDDAREAALRIAAASVGTGAAQGLDALPWIMVLGVPGSGRSALLASAGLSYAFVTPPSTPQAPHPVRWWITDRAVFLDPPGVEGGDAEWLTLLRELEGLRPGMPLHGALVTLSADMLSNASPEDLDRWARRLRERLDEMLTLLGVDLPVHVMITRCDLIPGFAEFFADLRGAERAQPWGFTLPTADTRPVMTRVADEVQALLRALSQRSLRRANVRDPLPARLAAFQFPLWFAAMRGNLLRVLPMIFGEDRARPPLLPRGLWFSSAADPGAQGLAGYFLRDVLAGHVAPDGALAVPSAAELRRRRLQRALFTTPLICAAALTSVLAVNAWRANRTLVDGFTAALNGVATARPPVPAARMEALRARTAELRAHVEEGPPRWMRLGMFVGHELAPRASTAFAVYALRDLARLPLADARRSLGAFVSAREAGTRASSTARAEATDQLRLYLLLTTPRAAVEPDPRNPEDAAWLAAQLTQRWAARAGAAPADAALILESARLFTTILADDPRLGTPRELEFVHRVRLALGP